MRRARAVLFLALALGYLLAALHQAFERHVLCPEHGELLDAVDKADWEADTCESCWKDHESNEGRDHEPCAASALFHCVGTASELSAEAVRPWPSFRCMRTSGSQSILTWRPIYQVAPKHSPTGKLCC